MSETVQFWITVLTPILVGVMGALVLRVAKGDKESVLLRDQRLEQKIDTVADKVSGVMKGISHVERQQQELSGRITELGQAHSELKGYVHARLGGRE